jgi:hypothetical protein
MELKLGLRCEKPESSRLILDTAAVLCAFYKPQSSIPKEKFLNLKVFIVFLLLYIYT